MRRCLGTSGHFPWGIWSKHPAVWSAAAAAQSFPRCSFSAGLRSCFAGTQGTDLESASEGTPWGFYWGWLLTSNVLLPNSSSSILPLFAIATEVLTCSRHWGSAVSLSVTTVHSTVEPWGPRVLSLKLPAGHRVIITKEQMEHYTEVLLM